MNRRHFILSATLLLAACAAPMTGGKGFASDRIAVTTVGSGPDVILIPGMGSSPAVWEETVASVPGYRYHLVQVAGFAGVPVGGNAGAEPVHGVAHDISRYIRESGLDRPALIGHSMGGTVAMTIAAHHPEQVGKLMVVDMVPFLGQMFGPPGTTAASIAPVAAAMRDQIAASGGDARRAAVEATIATMIRDQSRRAGPIAHSLASDVGLNARVMHELIVTDLRPELGRFKGPARVLYVRGPNIPLTDAQMDAIYAAQYASLPQATLSRVPDAYHFIMLDQPRLFAAEVAAFLKD